MQLKHESTSLLKIKPLRMINQNNTCPYYRQELQWIYYFLIFKAAKHQGTCMYRFLFYYSPTILFYVYNVGTLIKVNSFSATPPNWSNILKQVLGYCRWIVLSVLDHFVELTLKGLSLNHYLKIVTIINNR